ncbi:hypothetical protein PI125_g4152 [Phytophthora idaei]|nr:hypothetical protein PI125_g4152 [Phytophthora idaei]KAG3159481.1 hypothetical protein PI126_g7371 [Phytophthora idaei]
MARGAEQILKLTDVYYAEGIVHNLISYGRLDETGYVLKTVGGRRVVAERGGNRVAFDVELRRNVLMVCGTVEKQQERSSDVIMAALSEEADRPTEESRDVQRGTLVEFHRRLEHLNYDAVKD